MCILSSLNCYFAACSVKGMRLTPLQLNCWVFYPFQTAQESETNQSRPVKSVLDFSHKRLDFSHNRLDFSHNRLDFSQNRLDFSHNRLDFFHNRQDFSQKQTGFLLQQNHKRAHKMLAVHFASMPFRCAPGCAVKQFEVVCTWWSGRGIL